MAKYWISVCGIDASDFYLVPFQVRAMDNVKVVVLCQSEILILKCFYFSERAW